MKQFFEYISQFGKLNQQEIDFISKKAKELNLSKDEHFWQAKKIPQYVGFLLEGIIRVYMRDNNGEEYTRYFISENHLILGWENFNADIPALQAIIDCKLIVFSKEDWNEISGTITDWENMIRKATAKHLQEKLAKRSQLISQDATTRYLNFLKQFPTIVNRTPLVYIASYLGITQPTLSRVRKKISH